jgi:hypothetical protein
MEISPALVRVSLGWSTGEADIERFLAARRRLANALCREHSITAQMGWIGERFHRVRMVQAANMG